MHGKRLGSLHKGLSSLWWYPVLPIFLGKGRFYCCLMTANATTIAYTNQYTPTHIKTLWSEHEWDSMSETWRARAGRPPESSSITWWVKTCNVFKGVHLFVNSQKTITREPLGRNSHLRGHTGYGRMRNALSMPTTVNGNDLLLT